MRKKPKILVVDDEASNRHLLSRVLDQQGYQTVTAANGGDALKMVFADPPDLLVLDIVMPVLDGLSVCERLRGDFRTRGLPIILLTALGTLENCVKGFQAGADDYVTKPFQLDDLKVRVAGCLRRRRWDLWSHPLTGLPGSPSIEEEVRFRLKSDVAFAFAYLDIDHFKAFNDNYGYKAGDSVIKDLGASLVQVV